MRLLTCFTGISLVAFLLCAQDRSNSARLSSGAAPAPPAMTLAIPGFPDGGHIPLKFSQAAPGVAPGEGMSPAMNWANVPSGTHSLFLHMHDIYVVRNKTSDDQAHWVVWNIPASATGLPEGVPKGSQLQDGSYQISATGPMYPNWTCNHLAMLSRPART